MEPEHKHPIRILETFKIKARNPTIIVARNEAGMPLTVRPGMNVEAADGQVWKMTGVVLYALPPDELHFMIPDDPARPLQPGEILWLVTE